MNFDYGIRQCQGKAALQLQDSAWQFSADMYTLLSPCLFISQLNSWIPLEINHLCR